MIDYKEIAPVLLAGSRKSFVLFCYFYDWEFFRARPFLKEVMIAFQGVHDGKYRHISVSMPPRAGKSYVTSLFAAWTLGNKPRESVMRNTCTARLYEKFSYDTRNIVKSEKFQQVFPEVQLSADKQNLSGWNLKTSKQVGYFGAGVGGTIIGFGASAVSITDDLYRGIEDALSATMNEKIQRWKEGSHDSRLEKNCPQIDIGTRWTKDDVIGKNVEAGRYDLTVVIRALDENDKSFCEEVKTTEEYLRIREDIEKFIWLAEYQQEPIEAEGLLFPSNQLNYYEGYAFNTKSESVDAVTGFIDIADTGEDHLCMPIGYNIGPKVFIQDVVFTLEGSEKSPELCAAKINLHKPYYVRIESNMGGSMYKNLIKPHVNVSVQLLGARAKANKHTRITMMAGTIKKYCHFRTDYEKGSDYDKFMKALTMYLRVDENKHDDAPDAVAGLFYFVLRQLPHLYKGEKEIKDFYTKESENES